MITSKLLIYIIIGIVVVGGGTGAYVYTQQNAETTDDALLEVNGNANVDVNAQVNANGASVSLKKLVEAGKPVKCTFSNNDASAVTNGTTYVANGKVKGEFDITSKTNSQNYQGYMIVDGDMMYMWSSQMAGQGIKAKVTASAQAVVEGQKPAINFEDNLSYKCESWRVDEDMFKLPSGITFIDINAAGGSSGSIKGVVPSEPSSQCAACDALDGSSRTQCRAALQCN